MQVVGDDLLCTNPARIKHAIRQKSCTTLLLKVNQIGTISESIEAVQLAKVLPSFGAVRLTPNDNNKYSSQALQRSETHAILCFCIVRLGTIHSTVQHMRGLSPQSAVYRRQSGEFWLVTALARQKIASWLTLQLAWHVVR